MVKNVKAKGGFVKTQKKKVAIKLKKSVVKRTKKSKPVDVMDDLIQATKSGFTIDSTASSSKGNAKSTRKVQSRSRAVVRKQQKRKAAKHSGVSLRKS